MLAVKVLVFDTGGTILDWHGGLVSALGTCGTRCGVERPWHEFANEYRRRAMRRMVGAVDPAFNIDDVHREVLDDLVAAERIDAFSSEDRRAIVQRWHELDAWPDFPAGLARLRARYLCVSFTILSLSLIIDTARRNGIVWDAVIPCEMLRVYKSRPQAYRLAAKYLAIPPGEIMMVACHNFDLDAAGPKASAPPLCAAPTSGDRPDRPILCQIRRAIWSSTASPSSRGNWGRDHRQERNRTTRPAAIRETRVTITGACVDRLGANRSILRRGRSGL
jgi:2-haloacid dehalogenase